MLSLLLAAAVYCLTFTSVAAASSSKLAQPACVAKCWTNSQYVSFCGDNTACLCDDSDFQNAVYQCLYSQCHTSQFGIALHHALGLCSKPKGAQTTSSIPALIRQQENLKKRAGMASVSNSRSASVSNSAYRSVSNSVRYTYSRGSPSAAPPPEPTYTMMVSQISDGQIQAPPYTMMVSQISDGQVQAPTFVTQITDGQPQAPTYAAMMRKQ